MSHHNYFLCDVCGKQTRPWGPEKSMPPDWRSYDGMDMCGECYLRITSVEREAKQQAQRAEIEAIREEVARAEAI